MSFLKRLGKKPKNPPGIIPLDVQNEMLHAFRAGNALDYEISPDFQARVDAAMAEHEIELRKNFRCWIEPIIEDSDDATSDTQDPL